MVVINDFKEIEIVGSVTKGKSLESIEKGHYEMLEAFVQFLRGERTNEDLPLIDEGVLATKCAVKILEAAKNKM